MPVLTWIGKDKVVNHDKDLPFKVLKPVKELSVGKGSKNLLIEGDNLEALKALMPFYYNKVKCIYIDPPYNTGSEKWVYNDKVNSPQIKAWLNKVVGPEDEDLCRHDKWLCMMYPRLKLLKDLLTEDGVIFISIDDNEQSNLKRIMDEIFGERNFVANIIWQKKFSRSNDATYFSTMHDYILCYAKNHILNNSNGFRINLLSRKGKIPAGYSNPDDDPRGLWASVILSAKSGTEKLIYEVESPSGKKHLPPSGRYWSVNKERLDELIKDNRIWFGKNGNGSPRLKTFLSEVQEGLTPNTIWFHEEVGNNQEARQEVKKIFDGRGVFDSPKPSRLLKRILEIATDENSVVLDSFAGSGTTGQAVLETNKEDGGSRKFILVELEKSIAEKITSKRLEKVIEGYEGSLYQDGTGQDFTYLLLNGELYDNTGLINPDAKYEDLAGYIYFTETRNYLDLKTIKEPYIGSLGSNHYFLFFEGKGNNVLDEKSLKKTESYKGTRVIYADKCLLDGEYLEKHGIVFKQIPYELKKY